MKVTPLEEPNSPIFFFSPFLLSRSRAVPSCSLGPLPLPRSDPPTRQLTLTSTTRQPWRLQAGPLPSKPDPPSTPRFPNPRSASFLFPLLLYSTILQYSRQDPPHISDRSARWMQRARTKKSQGVEASVLVRTTGQRRLATDILNRQWQSWRTSMSAERCCVVPV